MIQIFNIFKIVCSFILLFAEYNFAQDNPLVENDTVEIQSCGGDGDSCTQSGYCCSGYCTGNSTWPGICATPPCGSLGGSCTGQSGNTHGSCCTEYICADCGTTAAAPGAAGTCCTTADPLRACGSGGLGATCTYSSQCQSQYQCKDGFCSCVAPAGIGCPCSDNGYCLSGICYMGLCSNPVGNCASCSGNNECESGQCVIAPGLSTGTCYISGCECGASTCGVCNECCVISGQSCTGQSGNTQGNCCSGLLCGYCGTTAAAPGELGICEDAQAPTLLSCNSAGVDTLCSTSGECQEYLDCVNNFCSCSSPAGLNCPCESTSTCGSPYVCGLYDTCVSCYTPGIMCDYNEQCCINNPYCISSTCSCAPDADNCTEPSSGNGCMCNSDTQCCSGSCMNVGGNTDGTCEAPGQSGATCYNSGNCAPGFWCDFSADPTSGICVCADPGGESCSCSNSSECTNQTYCNGVTCVVAEPLGITCLSSTECATNSQCEHVDGVTYKYSPQTLTFTVQSGAKLENCSCANGLCTCTQSVANLKNSGQEKLAQDDKSLTTTQIDNAQTFINNRQKAQENKQTGQATYQADKAIYQTDKATYQTDKAIYQSDKANRNGAITSSSTYQADKAAAQSQITVIKEADLNKLLDTTHCTQTSSGTYSCTTVQQDITNDQEKAAQDKSTIAKDQQTAEQDGITATMKGIHENRPSCICKDGQCQCTVGSELYKICVCSDGSCSCNVDYTMVPTTSDSCSCQPNGALEDVCSCAPNTGCTCYYNSQCNTGNCYWGVCQNTESVGMPCLDNGQCTSGLCLNGFCACTVNSEGKTQDSCMCNNNQDCTSGICMAGLCQPCQGEGATCLDESYVCCPDAPCSDTICGGMDAWINYIIMVGVTIAVIVTAGAAAELYGAAAVWWSGSEAVVDSTEAALDAAVEAGTEAGAEAGTEAGAEGSMLSSISSGLSYVYTQVSWVVSQISAIADAISTTLFYVADTVTFGALSAISDTLTAIGTALGQGILYSLGYTAEDIAVIDDFLASGITSSLTDEIAARSATFTKPTEEELDEAGADLGYGKDAGESPTPSAGSQNEWWRTSSTIERPSDLDVQTVSTDIENLTIERPSKELDGTVRSSIDSTDSNPLPKDITTAQENIYDWRTSEAAARSEDLETIEDELPEYMKSVDKDSSDNNISGLKKSLKTAQQELTAALESDDGQLVTEIEDDIKLISSRINDVVVPKKSWTDTLKSLPKSIQDYSYQLMRKLKHTDQGIPEDQLYDGTRVNSDEDGRLSLDSTSFSYAPIDDDTPQIKALREAYQESADKVTNYDYTVAEKRYQQAEAKYKSAAEKYQSIKGDPTTAQLHEYEQALAEWEQASEQLEQAEIARLDREKDRFSVYKDLASKYSPTEIDDYMEQLKDTFTESFTKKLDSIEEDAANYVPSLKTKQAPKVPNTNSGRFNLYDDDFSSDIISRESFDSQLGTEQADWGEYDDFVNQVSEKKDTLSTEISNDLGKIDTKTTPIIKQKYINLGQRAKDTKKATQLATKDTAQVEQLTADKVTVQDEIVESGVTKPEDNFGVKPENIYDEVHHPALEKVKQPKSIKFDEKDSVHIFQRVPEEHLDPNLSKELTEYAKRRGYSHDALLNATDKQLEKSELEDQTYGYYKIMEDYKDKVYKKPMKKTGPRQSERLKSLNKENQKIVDSDDNSIIEDPENLNTDFTGNRIFSNKRIDEAAQNSVKARLQATQLDQNLAAEKAAADEQWKALQDALHIDRTQITAAKKAQAQEDIAAADIPKPTDTSTTPDTTKPDHVEKQVSGNGTEVEYTHHGDGRLTTKSTSKDGATIRETVTDSDGKVISQTTTLKMPSGTKITKVETGVGKTETLINKANTKITTFTADGRAPVTTITDQ